MAATVLWILLAVGGALTVGSALRVTSLAGAPSPQRRRWLGSLAVWWVLFGVLVAIVLWGAIATGAYVLMRSEPHRILLTLR